METIKKSRKIEDQQSPIHCGGSDDTLLPPKKPNGEKETKQSDFPSNIMDAFLYQI